MNKNLRMYIYLFTLANVILFGKEFSLAAANIPMSSFELLLFIKLSKELVNDRLAFIKIVLPPRYWFKNSCLKINKCFKNNN